MIDRIICWFKGHEYRCTRQLFLPRQRCARCGVERVAVPNSGWIDIGRYKDDP